VSLFIPDVKAPVRPSLADLAASSESAPTGQMANAKFAVAYLRSYLLMRTIIGFIGITFPIVLIGGDHLLESNAPVLRTSMSAYYYSGMRDFFVAGLAVSGLFLITYRLFEKSLNNVLTVIGGLGALGVAFFPTDRFEGSPAVLTPLQTRLGEGVVSDVHHVSAGVFLVSLAIISFFFGVQEGRRPQQRATGRAMLPPAFWRWFHWICALLVLGGVTFVFVAKRQHMTGGHALLIGEIVAIVAFGLSWFFKGLELNILLGIGRAKRQYAASGREPAGVR
jgi:hypothetical protein